MPSRFVPPFVPTLRSWTLLAHALVLACLLAACTQTQSPPWIVSFQSSPASGEPGTTFRLSWEVRGLEDGTVTLSPGSNGASTQEVTARTNGGVGSVDVSPSESTTYELIVESPSGRAVESLRVVVGSPSGPSPSIASFTASPEAGAPGTSFELTWSVEDLAGGLVRLSPGPNGASTLDVTDRTEDGTGSVEVTPSESTTYELVAENAAGRATRTVEVVVETTPGPEPTIHTFESVRGQVNPGLDTSLQWEVDDENQLRLFGPELASQGVDVTGRGSYEVTPPAGARYTLRATNGHGSVDATVDAGRDVPATSFLIAGQSNAQGNNLELEEPYDGLTADPGVRMLGNDYVWKGAYEPLDDCTGQVDEVSLDPSEGCDDAMGNSGVSLGVSLGNRVADATGGTVFLVPAAKGGSSISEWMPPSDPYDRDELFGSAAHRARLADTERGAPLGYADAGDRHGAVVWYQGESDAESGSTTSYADDTDEVLDRFQEILDAPVFLVQLARFHDPDSDDHENVQAIREDQRSMEWGARTVSGQASPRAEADRFLVVTHDLPLVNEHEDKHLTADAQIELGRRVSLAAREHLFGEAGVDGTGPRLEGVTQEDGTTLRLAFDVEVTAPDAAGPNAYSDYFSVFDGGQEVAIDAVDRDGNDQAAVVITLGESVSDPIVRYMPPEAGRFEVAADVVRAASCDEPMPGTGLCLPLPAFEGRVDP